jgi:hypothetical protein
VGGRQECEQGLLCGNGAKGSWVCEIFSISSSSAEICGSAGRGQQSCLSEGRTASISLTRYTAGAQQDWTCYLMSVWLGEGTLGHEHGWHVVTPITSLPRLTWPGHPSTAQLTHEPCQQQ